MPAPEESNPPHSSPTPLASLRTSARIGWVLGPAVSILLTASLTPQEEPLHLLERRSVRTAEQARGACVLVLADGRQGSGVILRSGLVITAAHVVASGTHALVVGSEGTRFEMAVSRADFACDLALLAGPGPTLESPLADAPEAALGTPTIVAGHPLGAYLDPAPTLSFGVSGRIRARIDADGLCLTNLLQIDAPAAPGSSGGGAFDLDGRLLGIVTATSPDERVTYLTPVRRIREFLDAPEDSRARLVSRDDAPPSVFAAASETREHRLVRRAESALAATRTLAVRVSVGGATIGGARCPSSGVVITSAEPFLQASPTPPKVAMSGGSTARVGAVVVDIDSGLALLDVPEWRLRPADVLAAEVADALCDRPVVGTLLYCLSNLGLEGGIASASQRSPPPDLTPSMGMSRLLDSCLQVDLRLDHGALGGPVVDASGRWVGIVVQHRLHAASWRGREDDRGAFGAYVADRAVVHRALARLRSGTSRRIPATGSLGLAESDSRSDGEAAWTVVLGESGGDLRRGDRVLTLDGEVVESARFLTLACARRAPGSKVVLGISRAGLPQRIEHVLIAAAGRRGASPSPAADSHTRNP